MKKDNYITTLVLMLALLFATTAHAHDFVVDGIYYNIDGTTATVTYKGSSPYDYSNEYSGSVTIPTTVTYGGITYPISAIGDNAFDACEKLTSINIPNSVTNIGNDAFSECSRLSSINIPNSVTNIGVSVFSYCDKLASISVDSDNPNYDSRNNCKAIIKTATNTLIAGCKNTIIPNSVTSIGNFAFEGCSGLTSVTIPNSVTSIGGWAFYNCSSLTSINIPNSVTNIGNDAFYECRKLNSMDIPNSVTTIGKKAFGGCSSLPAIDIPNSVTIIGEGAFSSCSNLTNISVANDNPNYDSRNSCNAIISRATNTLIAGCKNTIIPNSVTSIGNYAFQGCSGLTNIDIPNSVTSIGNFAFASCSGLTTINIPNSVTSIGDWAFHICSGLTSIYIGSSVTTIGNWTFGFCSSVNNVYCFATIPPTCMSDNSFNNYSATLHVPATSLAAYFTAPVLSNFENIVGDAIEPTGISISRDSVEIQLGEEIEMSATVTPANASCKEVTWYSTDPSIATVDNGIVTAANYGECYIIAFCFGMQAVCHISVTATNIITLEQQVALLLPNHILTLTPSPPVMPSGFTVTSSDPTVAAARVMNGKIQVVGIHEGTTTITVGSADGLAIPATCLVTVYTELGDLNSDGFVDISDVTSLINYILGLGGDETSVTIKNADVNDDGEIDVVDVTSLIATILGKTE